MLHANKKRLGCNEDCVACSFSIVVFFFDESGDISGLKQTMKLNLHVHNGSASLQGKSTGCLRNPSNKIQNDFFFSSSFLFHPHFPCNCHSVYTNILYHYNFRPVCSIGITWLVLCSRTLTPTSQPITWKPKTNATWTRVRSSAHFPWFRVEFFCSNQQLQGETMSSYFLSAVVNTSILSWSSVIFNLSYSQLFCFNGS